MEKTLEYAVLAAAKGFSISLSAAFSCGCPRHKDICEAAAQNGQLRCLKLAYENHCPLSDAICVLAATKGSLACLRFGYTHGCAMTPEVCAVSAACGSIECLMFARNQGAPWDEYTMFNAYYSQEGEANKCLQYAREQDCPCMKIEDLLKTFLRHIVLDPDALTYYRCSIIMDMIKFALRTHWDGFGGHCGFSEEEKMVLESVFQIYTNIRVIVNAYKRHKRMASKQKLDVFRKELMEKACHPRRYFTSCLDTEEQRDLGLVVTP